MATGYQNAGTDTPSPCRLIRPSTTITYHHPLNREQLATPYNSDPVDRNRDTYAYSLPPNAKLFSLSMSDVDFGHFIHGRPKYTASVANSVSETTVGWEQAFTGGSAAVAVSAVAGSNATVTSDADTTEDGYQVSLAEGKNVVTITVTAPNGTDTYAYEVAVTRASG